MKEVTGRRGLAAIGRAGGFLDAAYALKSDHSYPPATGRIAETYRQLAAGPMKGKALFNDLESRKWLLPRAQRPYRPIEFRSHLKEMVGTKRLHVLTGEAKPKSERDREEGARARPAGIAFKVTYNDGGAQGGMIGYRGVCSDRIMVQNVEVDRKVWCSNAENQCRRYCDAGRKGPRPRVPCYESELLRRKPMRFRTGVYHTGQREGEPIPIDVDKVGKGKIALLTTVPPERAEKDRIVFGCYRVGEVGTDDDGHFVESDGTMDVVVPEDIAMECRYWDYQQANRDGSRFWGSGLFRYLDDDAVQRFVEDMIFRLGDGSERDVIVRALGESVEPKPIRAHVGGSRSRSGGEGEEHRKLKELVAEQPKLVGLPAKSKSKLEHYFKSGDHVDVMFDLPNGTAAVVEVETTCPLPGAHQAVKYRALLEVQRSEAQGSGRVQAILVAHGFDQESRTLAKKYKIKLVELKA